MTPRDRLARLHCVNALFHALTGHDLYLASQVLEAIEAAAKSEPGGGGKAAEDLTARLESLHEQLLGCAPEAGFAFCDGAADRNAGPLFIRADLLAALRRNAARKQATIMVGNLPGSAEASAPAPVSSRKRTARAREHADTVTQLRELAARRANPRSLVTLLFV